MDILSRHIGARRAAIACWAAAFALIGCGGGGGDATDSGAGSGAAGVVAQTITTQPASVSAAPGSSATFTVVAAGGGLVYAWQRSTTGGVGWSNIAGASTASYAIAATDATMNGHQFRVVIQNAVSIVTSTPAMLTVTGAAGGPVISSQPGDRTTVPGRSATFKVNAAGSVGATYQWARNGAPIAGAVRETYTTPALQAADNGAQYAVTVTDSAGRSLLSRAATAAVLVGSASPRVEIAAGGAHSLARRADGTVFAWGGAALGQIDEPAAHSPQPLPVVLADGRPLTGAVAIGAGFGHALAVRSDGSLVTWGRNNLGQLGDGSVTDRSHAAPVLDQSGNALSDVVQAVGGLNVSAALKRDGTVWIWGFDAAALPISLRPVPLRDAAGVPLTGVSRIAMGSVTLIALKSNGTVWSWGPHSASGQGAAPAIDVETAAGVPLQGIDRVAMGHGVAAFVARDGRVFTWGSGWLGRSGPTQSLFAAVVTDAAGRAIGNVVDAAAGRSHTVLRLGDGSLLVFGDNSGGGLSANSTNLFEQWPVAVRRADSTPLGGVAQLSLSGDNTLLLGSDGVVSGWGLNQVEQLGRAVSSPVDYTFRNPIAIQF